MKSLIKFFEIPAVDVERAIKFYKNVFEIEVQFFDWGNEKMGMFPNNEGAISQAAGFKPCEHGVLVSFDAGSDLGIVLERIVENGGSVIVNKTKIEAENKGYFAVFIDSEGNRLGLYSDN